METLAPNTDYAGIMSDSRGPQLQAVLIFLLILCIVTVSLRCYTKYFIIKRFAIEDWLAVVALVRPSQTHFSGSPRLRGGADEPCVVREPS